MGFVVGGCFVELATSDVELARFGAELADALVASLAPVGSASAPTAAAAHVL